MKHAVEQVKINFTQIDFDIFLVDRLIQESLDKIVPTDFIIHLDQIPDITNSIIDDIMKELNKLGRKFKYSVSVLIQQKIGATLSYGSIYKLLPLDAAYLEDQSDGTSTYVKRDHPHVDVHVSVCGIKVLQR
jgi:hypothetical protein